MKNEVVILYRGVHFCVRETHTELCYMGSGEFPEYMSLTLPHDNMVREYAEKVLAAPALRNYNYFEDLDKVFDQDSPPYHNPDAIAALDAVSRAMQLCESCSARVAPAMMSVWSDNHFDYSRLTTTPA